MIGLWRWVDEGEVCDEGIEKSGGEGILRCETVANGETAAVC